MFFDTHVHFDSFAEPGELDGVLDRCAAAGVDRMVAVGGSVTGNRLAASLAERCPDRIVFAAGFDRDLAVSRPDLGELRALLARPGAAAVGETGLDYYYGPETVAEQRALFRDMLGLAAEFGLPAIVHSREADDDTIALLNEAVAARTAPGCPGVLHCFTGSARFAERVLDLGLWISFSGIVTFRNADPLREVARQVPDDRLLIETDSPYLAPVPVRGRKNEPAYVTHVAAMLAKIRNDSIEHIAHITAQNAQRLFGIHGAVS